MKQETKCKAIGVLDKCAFFLFAAMVFFLPISNAAIEIIFCHLFVCFLIKAAIVRPSFGRIKNFFANRINLSLLVFYLAIGLSIFSSPALWQKSFSAWFFKWGEGVFLFYFAQIFLNKKDIKKLVYVFIVSSFLICINGLYQKVTGLGFIRGYSMAKGVSFLAIRSTFSHYNGFATSLTANFFITVGAIIKAKKLLLRIIFFILILLIFINLLLTYSRGAWLSLIFVNLFLVLFVSNNKQKTFFFILVMFFGISIFSIPFLRERVLFIMQSGGDADRFKVWQIAINMFKDSPIFGRGIGLFMHYFSQYDPGELYITQYAHNCYLQILAETGIVGIVFFVWFLIEILKQSFKYFVVKFDAILLGFASAFGAYLIHMFFDTQLYSLRLAILFWILASFLVITGTQKPSHETSVSD
jgi:O-antigen ligase